MSTTTAPNVNAAWLETLAWDLVVGEDGDDADYLVTTHLRGWTVELKWATDARELGRELLDRLDPNRYSVTVERFESRRGFNFRVVVTGGDA